MYEALTDNARRAMVIANRVATEAGHEYIGTAHMLVGILDDDSSLSARALAKLGIDVHAFRSEVEQLIKGGKDPESVESASSPPRSKRATELALALREAMKHDKVDCDHFLLGLFQEGQGLAAQRLVKSGVTFEALKEEISRLRDDRR